MNRFTLFLLLCTSQIQYAMIEKDNKNLDNSENIFDKPAGVFTTEEESQLVLFMLDEEESYKRYKNFFLKNPQKINYVDQNGHTSLHTAIRLSHDHLALWLLQQGTKTTIFDKKGLLPVHTLSKLNSFEKFEKLLDYFLTKTNLNQKTLDGSTLRQLIEKEKQEAKKYISIIQQPLPLEFSLTRTGIKVVHPSETISLMRNRIKELNLFLNLIDTLEKQHQNNT